VAVPPAGTMANDSINTDILHTQTMDYTSKTVVTAVIVREWRPLLEIFGNDGFFLCEIERNQRSYFNVFINLSLLY